MNKNTLAQPTSTSNLPQGLTKREYAAIRLACALVAKGNKHESDIPKIAVEIANQLFNLLDRDY